VPLVKNVNNGNHLSNTAETGSTSLRIFKTIQNIKQNWCNV